METSRITFIGLGLMGAAIAQAIQRAGHDLTVWNRSPDKMQPFLDNGAKGATDAAGAIAASPVTVICIDNYASTRAMLGADDVEPLLSGKTIVELTTGSPTQATEAEEWIKARGVRYIDGAILAGPRDIDSDSGEILLCGDAAAHDDAADLLQSMAGKVRYLGENIRAASALDLAWLTVRYGEFISTAHAVNLCQSEGADIGDFISLFPDLPVIQERAGVIHNDSFDKCTATLDVWGAALAKIQKQGKDAGINTGFPDFVAQYFERASAAGYGGQHAMAIYKVLRDRNR